MAKGSRNIEPWEAALIKAMLAERRLTKDQIVAHFTRPDRTVNPWRLAEIDKSEVEPATAAQVDIYLRTFQRPQEARQRFFDESPLHPVNLRSQFRPKEGVADCLDIGETDRIECKESLNFGRVAEYARVIVSFANARGGFLLFGVRDADKSIVGITPDKLTGYDPAKLNQHLSEHFAPVPVWEKTEMAFGDKRVGILYVHPAQHRPIICIKDAGDVLREADIYYRYPGETRRIKYAELAGLLDERSRTTERQWATVIRQVEAAGVENVAILDTMRGEVTGRSGKFLIDEKLIPKLKFVAEGHFSETEGAPTLRLVGDMEPIALSAIEGAKTVVKKERVTDGDLLREFAHQAKVEHPRLYIGHLAHSAKVWLPIFYFMRQAKLDEAAAIRLLSDEPDAKSKHVEKVVDRVRRRGLPSMAQLQVPGKLQPERSQIIAGDLPPPETKKACDRFLKAVMTLEPGDIRPEYLLPLLAHSLERFGDALGALTNNALSYVDVVWHEQEIRQREGAS